MATVGVNGLMFYRTSLTEERTITLLSDCTSGEFYSENLIRDIVQHSDKT